MYSILNTYFKTQFWFFWVSSLIANTSIGLYPSWLSIFKHEILHTIFDNELPERFHSFLTLEYSLRLFCITLRNNWQNINLTGGFCLFTTKLTVNFDYSYITFTSSSSCNPNFSCLFVSCKSVSLIVCICLHSVFCVFLVCSYLSLNV